MRALEWATLDGTRPDLTFILDLPAEIGLARAAERRRAEGKDADRFEGEGRAFHERLRDAFLAIAHDEPDRCVVIDAAREPDLVAGDIWRSVADRLLGQMPTELTASDG